jgi:hypothetical protein
MKQKYGITIFMAFVILISNTPCFSQDYGNVRIVSESKQIFTDKAILKQIADDSYFAKSDIIKTKLLEELKREMKSLTGQSSYAEQLSLSGESTIEFREENNRVYMKYLLPYNNLDFQVTTADVPILGVGIDRIQDPKVYISFAMESEFEISQTGQLESIRFLNPKWKFSYTRYSARNLQTLSLDKTSLDVWVKIQMPNMFKPVFLTLSDMNDDLNNYINTAIKNNPALLKELEIDENQIVTVLADPLDNTTLLFKHNYSPKGIVKRNLTTDASIVAEEVKSIPPPAGTTTSAADIDKKPSAATQGPVINKPAGTSTKPTDFDKKPNSATPGSKINKPPVRNN